MTGTWQCMLGALCILDIVEKVQSYAWVYWKSYQYLWVKHMLTNIDDILWGWEPYINIKVI